MPIPMPKPMPMRRDLSAPMPDLRLAELLSALSHALDMVEGQPAGHCVRACWIGIHIGRELGLSEAELSDLYYTLLMKDVGCSSNAARISQLYMTDDISFKRDFMTVNGSLPQVLRFVLSHTGMNASLAERFRALVNVFQNGGEIAHELMETRCDRGAEIARKMRFSEKVAEAIRALDEHWDGGGMPKAIGGGGAARSAAPDRNLVRSKGRLGFRSRRRASGFLDDAAVGRSANRYLRSRTGAAAPSR